MRVLLPSAMFLDEVSSLAPRPASLKGKVVGFLDGWGCRLDDGSFGMYPLMDELRRLLEERCGLGGHIWLHKPNISKDAPPEQMETLVERTDVVINGECA